jgi:hypothetical protein
MRWQAGGGRNLRQNFGLTPIWKGWHGHNPNSPYVRFSAKMLVANGCSTITLTNSCQIICQVWVEDFLAKKLASQF